MRSFPAIGSYDRIPNPLGDVNRDKHAAPAWARVSAQYVAKSGFCARRRGREIKSNSHSERIRASATSSAAAPRRRKGPVGRSARRDKVMTTTARRSDGVASSREADRERPPVPRRTPHHQHSCRGPHQPAWRRRNAGRGETLARHRIAFRRAPAQGRAGGTIRHRECGARESISPLGDAGTPEYPNSCCRCRNPRPAWPPVRCGRADWRKYPRPRRTDSPARRSPCRWSHRDAPAC